MKFSFAVLSVVCGLACSSTTVGPATPWGTLGGISFAPVDAFFLPTSTDNGDFNFVVVAVDQLGYCQVLEQNLNGYLPNMNYATFTLDNAIGTGAINPGPGVYPISALSPTDLSAQAAFGSVSNCAVSTFNPMGTSGSVTMQAIAIDGSQMSGSVSVVFGSSGTLSGPFNAPVCDISNAIQGANACSQ